MVRKLKIPAIQYIQNKKKLYSMVVDGKDISKIASVTRVSRDQYELFGYQRPEIVNHITEIREYLESPSAMLPNSIVIAFDSKTVFKPRGGSKVKISNIMPGILEIPVNKDREKRSGWIVDGQQRTAALREADVESFPVSVVGFLTSKTNEQKEQFILVNSTKPLNKDLIYELLPGVDTQLNTALSKKIGPATIADILNNESDSPFYGKIKRPTNPNGVISFNSVLKMLENSLTDGLLFEFSDLSNNTNVKNIKKILFNYWGAVAEVFPEAWSKIPRLSRLTHGTGLTAMGFLMDSVYSRVNFKDSDSKSQIINELEPLKPLCSWTEGSWDFGSEIREWNSIQNIQRDVELVTNFILNKYNNS